MCVQNFDDSRGLAIRITYRISLRSSSLWEPRHPLLKVVLVVRAASESGPAETTSHSNQESFRSATKPQQGKQAEATTQHQTGTHASQPPPAQECPSTAERKCAFPHARIGSDTEPPSRTTQLLRAAGNVHQCQARGLTECAFSRTALPLPNCSLITSQMTRPEAKKAIPTETSRAHRLCI